MNEGGHMINSQREPQSNLTIHTVEGRVTVEDILKAIEAFYAGNPTLCAIWDFRQAEVTHIYENDVQRLVAEVKQYADFRQGGKTALVFSRTLGYGQGRMFQSNAEIKKIPVAFSCFYSMEEALDWLRKPA